MHSPHVCQPQTFAADVRRCTRVAPRCAATGRAAVWIPMPPCTHGRSARAAVSAIGANHAKPRLETYTKVAERARIIWSFCKVASDSVVVCNASRTAAAAAAAVCSPFASMLSRAAALAAAIRTHGRWCTDRWDPGRAAAGWTL